MNTDPETIAREILRLDADRSAAEPQGDFLDYMVALRKTAPALAAAYLDLRATSTEALEAERIRCTRQAERDAARRDAAYLDLRAQLDAVMAQRDAAVKELRRDQKSPCQACGAYYPSSTWMGSRNMVFVVRQIVHENGCPLNAAVEVAEP